MSSMEKVIKEHYPSSMNKQSHHETIINPFIILHILCGLWYISPFGSIFTLISSHSSLEIFFFCSLSQNKDGTEKNIPLDRRYRKPGRKWVQLALLSHPSLPRIHHTSKQSFYLQGEPSVSLLCPLHLPWKKKGK